jgi:homoserine kinase
MSSSTTTTTTNNNNSSSSPKRQKTLPVFGIERNSVKIDVPATTANLGSGYDCIGMAIDLHNELTVTRSDKFEITVEGEGAEFIPLDETNIVCIALRKAFQIAGKPVPPLKYHLKQGIPHARGLGSSSAAIVAGLLAGLVLTGHRLDVQGKEELLQLATEIEGHPDNVAAAIYGGCQMCIYSSREKRYKTERLSLPHDLVCVAFIPEPLSTAPGKKTEQLRKVVPQIVPLKDTVSQVGHFGWLVHALITGKIENLRDGFEDLLHQRQRAEAVYKHLLPMIDAAYEAGAVGAWLSGAGPTVLVLVSGGAGDFFTQMPTYRRDNQVAEALRKVAAQVGIEGNVYVTHIANTGGVVIAADPPYSTSLLTYNGMT